MRGTTITLGGRERVLRYDLNALAEIGDRLGILVRLAHIQEDLVERELPLSAIRTFIWAGLIAEEPELTEKEVGAMVDLKEDGPRVMQDFFGLFAETSREINLGVGNLTQESGEDDDRTMRAAG